MTLDNEGNPNIPRLPSDPPPRRAGGAQTAAEGVAAPAATMAPESPSQDTSDRDDATTVARKVTRAVFNALDAAARAPIAAAVAAWARDLAALGRSIPDVGDDARQLAARAETAAELVTERMMEGLDAPARHAAGAIIGAWFVEGFGAMAEITVADLAAPRRLDAFAVAVERIAAELDAGTEHQARAASRTAPSLVRAILAALPLRRARIARRNALVFLELAAALDAVTASTPADTPDARELEAAAKVALYHARVMIHGRRPATVRATEALVAAVTGEGADGIAGMAGVVSPVLTRGSRRGIAVLRALDAAEAA